MSTDLIRETDRLLGEIDQLLEVAQTSSFSVTEFGSLQSRFRRRLFVALAAFRRGSIDADELENRWSRAIDDSYEPAYRMGVAQWPTAGFGDTDRKFLRNAVRSETGFVSRFAQAVATQNLTDKQVDARLEQYALGLDSMKTAGWTRKAPPETMFEWVLQAGAAHCADCLTLSAASPWPRDQIPTVPAGGDTSCRSRCKCRLEIVPGARRSNEVRVVTDDPDATSGRRLGGGVPTDEERARIDDLRSRINYHRRRIDTAKTDAARDAAIAGRKQANAELIDFLRVRQIRDVPMLDVGDVLSRRQIEPDVVDVLVLRGIDGASLSLLDEETWRSSVRDLLARITALEGGG